MRGGVVCVGWGWGVDGVGEGLVLGVERTELVVMLLLYL